MCLGLLHIAACQNRAPRLTGPLTADFQHWLIANGYESENFDRSDVGPSGSFGGRTRRNQIVKFLFSFFFLMKVLLSISCTNFTRRQQSLFLSTISTHFIGIPYLSPIFKKFTRREECFSFVYLSLQMAAFQNALNLQLQRFKNDK